MAALCLAGASASAKAASCTYTPETPRPIIREVQLGGSITVGRDRQVGDEIYRATLNTVAQARLNCPLGAHKAVRQYVTSPGTPSSYTHPRYGAVYPTSVPGIGYAIWYGGQNGPQLPQSVDYPGGADYLFNIAYDVSFFKIGNVTPGVINGAQLASIEGRMMGDSNIQAFVGRIIGSLNIVARTCTTPDVNVKLGDFRLDVLKGVGSTTPEVEVPIDLKNCPAFFGQYRRDLTNDSGVNIGVPTLNTIDYRVDPTSTVLVPAAGVVALTSGGATGIGVQLKNTNKSPVTFGNQYRPNLTLTQVDGANYRISLWANYYQVSATTTPGKANATVTMTLIYQ